MTFEELQCLRWQRSLRQRDIFCRLNFPIDADREPHGSDQRLHRKLRIHPVRRERHGDLLDHPTNDRLGVLGMPHGEALEHSLLSGRQRGLPACQGALA